MTQEEIINGSKLIAEFLGWQYIPFSADLKHKAGWWSKVPKTEEDRFFSKINGNDGFICRNHKELRFWNSLDALIPVIQKIEKEGGVSCYLHDNGCTGGYGLTLEHLVYKISSFDLPNWSNNVFKVIVKYLETIKA
jgi:hypothetical protein